MFLHFYYTFASMSSTAQSHFIDTSADTLVLDDDLSLREQDAMCVNESKLHHQWWHKLKYVALGLVFGVILVKGEVISWYRIQEMFRLQSFHMYGIIGSAGLVGAVSVYVIRRFNIRTIYGEQVVIKPKTFNKGQIYGGLLFGLGWGVTGACPGPLYAQLGTGALAVSVVILSALAGTWVYGWLRPRLPH